MKKNQILSIASFACLMFLSLSISAQYTYDAYRFSEVNQTGTARVQALGGNHAAIGGDGSAISGNPAGLGFYNRSELSISPGFSSFNTSTSYLNGITKDSKTNFNLPNFSLVLGGNSQHANRKWRRTTFGISYSRQQSFQNQFSYSGLNKSSAYVDHVVETANGNKMTVNQLNEIYEDPSSGKAFSTSLPGAYYQVYAFDPTVTNGVEGPPYQTIDGDKDVNQFGSYISKGAHSQWTFAYAGNYDDKLYIGISGGFNRIKYSYDHVLDESLVNGATFKSYRFGEALDVTGNGVNATIGAIYKATPTFQFGASISSPTYTSLTESFYQDVSVALVTPDNLPTAYAVAPNDFSYNILSPFKASGGVTYFLGAKKAGFLTASLDYVGYRGMRVYSKDQNAADSKAFREFYKREISDTYKNVVNLRVGGEYRLNIMRLRLGLSYFPDPYRVKTDDLDRNKLIFSGGIGVRTRRVFVDLTGNFSAFDSSFTPYVLNDSSRFFTAETRNKVTNVMLTLGTTF